MNILTFFILGNIVLASIVLYQIYKVIHLINILNESYAKNLHNIIEIKIEREERKNI